MEDNKRQSLFAISCELEDIFFEITEGAALEREV